MIRPLVLFCATAFALSAVACGPTPDVPWPTTSSAPAVSTPAATSTAPEPTMPAATLDFTTGERVLLPSPGQLDPGWAELFALPYGDGQDQLGTSPGGEGLEWGPSYGTQLPDGTWWFLDTAHLRLAHYDEGGGYLGDAPLSEEHLAQGEFFQWQSPVALADGTVVLQSTTPDRPGLLRLSPGGAFSQVGMDAFASARTTDGALLYGFDDAGAPVSVNPTDGAIRPVDAFLGQDARPYSLEVGQGSLDVTLGELSFTIPLAAAELPDAVLHPSLEAATGSDGVLTVLVNGFVELEPGTVLDALALLRIDESGRGTVEALPPLTSEADPGDGAHLGVRIGDDRPWLMVVGADALHIYRRG